jgi:hypothetical protein
MPSFIPEPWKVAHIARAIDTSDDDDTGNPRQVDAPPVIRTVRSIAQEGHDRGSSRQVISAEFVKRIDTHLIMAVSNTEVYSPQDQVRLFPDVDENNNYIAGTGVAFWVDGLSRDDRTSPWPALTRWTGGSVRLVRVT